MMYHALFKAATAAILLSRLGAAECPPPNSTYHRVSNQADIDILRDNCSTIPGTIAIQSDYQGGFNLSGVTNATTITNMDIESPITGTPTSFVLDDLIYIYNLQLEDMTLIRDIILPKLITANSLLLQASATTSVSCPALISAGTVSFTGRFLHLNFPVLAHSDIDTSNVTGDISFPALKSAHRITMSGDFSSLSVPLLETISPENATDDGKMESLLFGGNSTIEPLGAINMNFPALKNIHNLTLSNINNLSTPALRTAKSLTLITAANQTDDFVFNLTTLVDVGNLTLLGKFSDVFLPSLERLNTSMKIESTIGVSCTSARAAFDHAVSLNGNSTIASNGTSIPKIFICEGNAGPAKKIDKVTYGLGIGLGLGGGFAAIVLTVLVLRKRRERKEVMALALGGTEKEMGTRGLGIRGGIGSGKPEDKGGVAIENSD